MIIKSYKQLPEESKLIRKAVFVDEQGFQHEFDEIDSIAVHLVLFDADNPIATCRFYWNENKQSYTIGRIAVIKDYRKKNFGKQILCEAEKQIQHLGGKTVCLSAQIRASGFYEKQGYYKVGDIFYDEYCPHVLMWKDLGK